MWTWKNEMFNQSIINHYTFSVEGCIPSLWTENDHRVHSACPVLLVSALSPATAPYTPFVRISDKCRKSSLTCFDQVSRGWPICS